MAASPVSTASFGQIIRHALFFNPKRWPDAATLQEDLSRIVPHFFQLLKERHIDYVLVGDIAMLYYVDGRNTEDINLILSLPSLAQLPEIEITGQERYFARGHFQDLKIDLLLTTNALFERVQRSYSQQLTFADQAISCATVEGLLLLKLYALPSLYRQGNFARVGLYENDIATLLHRYRPDMNVLFRELAHHLSPSDIAAVREVIADIKHRLQRFADRSPDHQSE